MGLPVVSQKAVKSGTEPGSVANTSKVAPIGKPERAVLVLRIGSGQARPFKSKVLSAMGVSPTGVLPFSSPQISSKADNWQQSQANAAPAACVAAARTPRCPETWDSLSQRRGKGQTARLCHACLARDR